MSETLTAEQRISQMVELIAEPGSHRQHAQWGADAAVGILKPMLQEACERYVVACTRPGLPITIEEARNNIRYLLEALGDHVDVR